MKKLLFGIISILIVAQFCAAQSIKIVPKKVTYKRPQIAEDDAFGMRYFTVIYPKIISVNGRKIESLLSYEKLFEFKLEEEFTTKRGISNLKYKTLFNSRNILSIKLILNAYTFSDLHHEKVITINTRTAKTVETVEVFKNLRKLAAKCRNEQIKKINEVKKDYEPEDYGTIFDSMKFTTEELKSFTVGKKGITFRYPYTFGRTSIVFEPNADYFFTWKELRPFIKKGGLFAQFVK